MDKPLLQIVQKKHTGEASVISMRLPKNMPADIDEAARIKWTITQ